jgi:hypothetical protein
MTNGFIVEYVTQGWPTVEIQLGAKEANIDESKEVLSIWAFDNEEECELIIRDLRKFRNQQSKELV